MAAHWQGCPTAASSLRCKSYQTSKNEVRTIKHFADGKYVLHLFRKGNGGWSVAIYLCPLRKLLFWVFSHALVLVVQEAVSVKGFQLQPLGEPGEPAQGREAAFNHPFWSTLRRNTLLHYCQAAASIHHSFPSQCEWFLLFCCPSKELIFIFALAWWGCRTGHHPTGRRGLEAHASLV